MQRHGNDKAKLFVSHCEKWFIIAELFRSSLLGHVTPTLINSLINLITQVGGHRSCQCLMLSSLQLQSHTFSSQATQCACARKLSNQRTEVEHILCTTFLCDLLHFFSLCTFDSFSASPVCLPDLKRWMNFARAACFDTKLTLF